MPAPERGASSDMMPPELISSKASAPQAEPR
jgi:hypothetical protein